MLAADYFDGQSSRRHSIMLGLKPGYWVIEGDAINLKVPVGQARLADKIGSAPRQLHFDTGAYCLIADHARFESLLQAAGMMPHSKLARWEKKWRYALASVVIMLAFFAALYQWGLPVAASWVAQRLPAELTAMMDKQTLTTLEGHFLTPSTLSMERQQALASQFSALQTANSGKVPAYTLIFRHSEAIGPNAFALPGGTILVTDTLVKLADQSSAADAQVLGVLTHELGHVHYQHALRQFVQGTIVAAFVTWYLGDFSSLLAAAPIALLNTRYTRAFEEEADDYAATMMVENGLSPAHLADMLASMQAHGRPQKDADSQAADENASKAEYQWLDYFSTHPNTEARIAKLRNWSAKDKAP